jgi:hypothetical protein
MVKENFTKSYFYNQVKNNYPNIKVKSWIGTTLKYWKNKLEKLVRNEKRKIREDIERKYGKDKVKLSKKASLDKWKQLNKELEKEKRELRKIKKEQEKSIKLLRRLRKVDYEERGLIKQKTRFNESIKENDKILSEILYLSGYDLIGVNKNDTYQSVVRRFFLERKNNEILNKRYDIFFNGLWKELKRCYDKCETFKNSVYDSSAIIKVTILMTRLLKEKRTYIFSSNVKTIKLSQATIKKALKKNDYDMIKNIILNKYSSIECVLYCVGYNIFMPTPINMDIKTIKEYAEELRAFSPTCDKAYHELTQCSTTKDRLCIYQTYLYLYVDKNAIKKDKTLKYLEKESEEIKKYIKEGQLFNFCKEKSKEKGDMIIEFFKPDKYLGIIINGDEVTEVTDHKYLDNKKVFLYDCQHVAPRRNIIHGRLSKKYNKNNYANIEKKRNKFFTLKSSKPKETLISDIYAYDFETMKINDNGDQIPYCCGVKHEKIEKCFYGDNVIKEFCDFLDEIKTETNISKTNKKCKQSQILLYGFNNSRFDNIFIFFELYKRNPKIKYIINSGYKYIKYHNIRIYDLNLYYSGSLSTVAQNFKLNVTKSIYPYTFATKDKLNYIGKVPNKKYWNSEEDYKECKKEHEGIEFNMMEYTKKYCLKDCELALKIALKHLEQCKGTINGKPFDVRLTSTSAGISLKLFSQVFLNDQIKQTSEEQQSKERNAYYGGRTEVFKKHFKGGKDHKLYYIDINSSYPYAMTKMLPAEFIKNMKYDEETEKKEFVDYYLYNSRTEYIGDKENVIPNIFMRSKKGEIMTALNTNYGYHWGCELTEALKNGFKVYINEVCEYRGKTILKEYAEYMYKSRLENKKNNASLAEFYKLCMNSLYGKFGQKEQINIKICRNGEDIRNISCDMNCKIQDFEVLENDNILLKYSRIDDNKSIGSLVRFSSCISAYARCNLSMMMRKLGHEHIFYCDTDSIFTDVEPPEELISQTELGKWKEEECKKHNCKLHIVSAQFLAPKMYSYLSLCDCECKKAKGQPKELLKREFYEKMETGKLKSKKLINNKMFIRTLSGVRIIKQARTMKPVYNKRIWKNNESKSYGTYQEWHDNKYGKKN